MTDGPHPTYFMVGPDDDPDTYRLRRQIGGGGEAELWQADVARAGARERVAVTIIRPELAGDPTWRERWAEQAELLRLIQHPGIAGMRAWFEGARMHLPGRAGDQPERALYLVTDWVDGEDLCSWVPRHRDPADLPAALRLLGQVAAVLDWLHSGKASRSGRPVVHGDISPANVVVNRDGQAVLVDFGLLRAAGHVTEAPAGTAGTPGYCAPEVVAGGEYGPASDRYAFGGLAYYVLTGEHPDPDQQRLRDSLARVEALAEQPVGAQELATIFAADPAQRPAASQWLRLLRRQTSTASALAVAARPAAGPGGRSRWLRWPRVAALGSAVVLLAVVLGAALGAGVFAPDPTGGAAATDPPRATPPPPSPSRPPAAATPSPTVDPTPSPVPTAPAETPWPGEPTGTTRIVGNVELEDCRPPCGRHVDLDQNQTTFVDERVESDLTATEDGVGAQGDARLAPWSGSEPPTLAECRALPEEQWLVPFIPADRFDEPATYCVWSSDGRYGYLQTQRATSTRYYFYYLLWTRPDDQAGRG